MLRTVEDGSRNCTTCFTGNDPAPVPSRFQKIGFDSRKYWHVNFATKMNRWSFFEHFCSFFA
jgi:hypothetical protein